jgi:hypothetical protein
MKDWRDRSRKSRQKKQKAAELRKQRREYEEENRAAKVRQRLKEERLRVTLNRWDNVIKAWLHEVAQATWREEKKRWKLRRTVGHEFNLFGIHWEAGWSESSTSITGHSYVQGAYYRVTLVTDDDFRPIQFVIECRHENRRKNKRIETEASMEDLKAALMEASQAGPAQRYYVFEER